MLRTEQERVLEEEADILHEVLADTTEKPVFFKEITFETIGTARKLLKEIKKDTELAKQVLKELKEKIESYEEYVEEDTRMAME